MIRDSVHSSLSRLRPPSKSSRPRHLVNLPLRPRQYSGKFAGDGRSRAQHLELDATDVSSRRVDFDYNPPEWRNELSVFRTIGRALWGGEGLKEQPAVCERMKWEESAGQRSE